MTPHGAHHFTVLGAGGFVGRALAAHLTACGHDVHAPGRTGADELLQGLRGRDLGHIVYCIGLTADFRTKPYATVEAHTTLLARVLETCTFRSLVYLSSTRVYSGAEQTHERAVLKVQPLVVGDIYNLSKLLGESLCVNSGNNCRIARLSNVFGPEGGTDTFLGAVAHEAAAHGRVIFRSSPESEKDYVSLSDVVRWLALIGPIGDEPVYNLASGYNTSNRALAAQLELLGVTCEFAPAAPTVAFPRIDASRVDRAFGPATETVLSSLSKLIEFARADRR